jgi:hypothetical protein
MSRDTPFRCPEPGHCNQDSAKLVYVSYDLAVWEGDRPGTDQAATEAFTELMNCREAREAEPPSERIGAYVTGLLSRWPDITQDHGDDSPWADGPLINNAFGSAIYFGISGGAEEASEYAARLAAAHGLVCYDPQSGSLRPSSDSHAQASYASGPLRSSTDERPSPPQSTTSCTGVGTTGSERAPPGADGNGSDEPACREPRRADRPRRDGRSPSHRDRRAPRGRASREDRLPRAWPARDGHCVTGRARTRRARRRAGRDALCPYGSGSSV